MEFIPVLSDSAAHEATDSLSCPRSSARVRFLSALFLYTQSTSLVDHCICCVASVQTGNQTHTASGKCLGASNRAVDSFQCSFSPEAENVQLGGPAVAPTPIMLWELKQLKRSEMYQPNGMSQYTEETAISH